MIRNPFTTTHVSHAVDIRHRIVKGAEICKAEHDHKLREEQKHTKNSLRPCGTKLC